MLKHVCFLKPQILLFTFISFNETDVFLKHSNMLIVLLLFLIKNKNKNLVNHEFMR